jgi:hypothetical protein
MVDSIKLSSSTATILNIFVQTSQGQKYTLKFIYSEKATKFCEIVPLLLTVSTVVKSKGKISQSFGPSQNI